MSNTDGLEELRRLVAAFPEELPSLSARGGALIAAWEAERQACQSAVEEADRLRFAAEAQAAADRAALAQAREVMARIEREAREQIAAPDTNAAQMVVSEAVAETCRRIADVLEGGAR